MTSPLFKLDRGKNECFRLNVDINEYNRIVSQYPVHQWNLFKIKEKRLSIDYDDFRLLVAVQQETLPFTPYMIVDLVNIIKEQFSEYLRGKGTHWIAGDCLYVDIDYYYRRYKHSIISHFGSENDEHKKSVTLIPLDNVVELSTWLYRSFIVDVVEDIPRRLCLFLNVPLDRIDGTSLWVRGLSHFYQLLENKRLKGHLLIMYDGLIGIRNYKKVYSMFWDEQFIVIKMFFRRYFFREAFDYIIGFIF